MRIRNPHLIKLLGLAGASFLRLWMGSVRHRFGLLHTDVDPTRPNPSQRFIYAVWHENLLQPICRYAYLGIHVLISRHADGQLLSEICKRLNIATVRGSTRRGGIEALRQLVRIGRQASLALAPDGPRGPRRRVQPGLVYLAAQTGLPIIPVGIGYQRPWRFNSWDKFALPRPLSRAACVCGAPIVVPENTGRAALETYRQQVEEAMASVNHAAETWAETGKWPE